MVCKTKQDRQRVCKIKWKSAGCDLVLCGLLISVWNWQINNNYMEFQMMKIPRKKIWNPARFSPDWIWQFIIFKSIRPNQYQRPLSLGIVFCSYLKVFNLKSSMVGWLIIIIIKIKTMSQWAINWHLINDFIYSYDYYYYYYWIVQTRFLRMGWSAWKLLFILLCIPVSFRWCLIKNYHKLTSAWY